MIRTRTIKITVFVNPRHDPDRIVSYDPKTKKNETALEYLRSGIYPRNDIMLINVEHEGQELQQYMVYATPSGKPTGEGLKWLDAEERAIAVDLNRKILAVSKIHPEFKAYLVGER